MIKSKLIRLKNKNPYELLNWDDCECKTNGELNTLDMLASDWKLCIDIGANIGDYTRHIKKRAPRAKIISFEPNPLAAKKIKGLRTKVVVAAVGDSNKELLLHINDEDHTQSSAYRKGLSTKPFKVPQITLDEFIKEKGFKRIDFIKIDTEGHEVAVLTGAKTIIKEQLVDFIQFEYGGTYKDAGKNLKEVYDLLSEKYIICHILPKGLLPLNYSPGLETYRYSNWLAISRNVYN